MLLKPVYRVGRTANHQNRSLTSNTVFGINQLIFYFMSVHIEVISHTHTHTHIFFILAYLQDYEQSLERGQKAYMCKAVVLVDPNTTKVQQNAIY